MLLLLLLLKMVMLLLLLLLRRMRLHVTDHDARVAQVGHTVCC